MADTFVTSQVKTLECNTLLAIHVIRKCVVQTCSNSASCSDFKTQGFPFSWDEIQEFPWSFYRIMLKPNATEKVFAFPNAHHIY